MSPLILPPPKLTGRHAAPVQSRSLKDSMYRALIVCNSRFPKDPGALGELQGPKADGMLLRDALTDPATGLFQRSEVQLLSEAETPEVLAAADDFFSRAEPDDTLLFYYSGHGRSRNGQLYLCASNTKVQRLPSTAVGTATLTDIIDASFAQVKIIVLDCCHSGGFKGGEIFDELSGRGRFVIAATSAADLAADAEVRGEPSPFTKALVEGLLKHADDRNGDREVDLDDLFAYLSQVGFDGHEPHRKFDGAGAVPIARRIAGAPAAEPEPAPVPGPSAEPSTGTSNEAGHPTRVAFLEGVAKGEQLSEIRIDAFRRDLRDDIAATFPRQLTSTEFLQRAGLLKDGHPTRAGVLLFGQNPTALLPAAMVRCVRFRGTRKTDPMESLELHGTVPELIVQARDFVARSAELGELPSTGSAYSEPAYRYPMIAVREIIANAVVHRDYTKQHMCVHIHVFDDRIEVISPGGWGGATAVADGQVRLGTLEGHSQPRNFHLARLLTWAKLVESVGTGLPRSVADCRTVGSPEPVVVIRGGLITVTIFPNTQDAPRATPPVRRTQAVEYSEHLDAARMAQIVVGAPDRPEWVGSGYRVTNDTVLTAAHLLHRETTFDLWFPLDGSGWTARADVAVVDTETDTAVLRFVPPSQAPVVAPVRYGRITRRSAVVPVETAGFPAYKAFVEGSGSDQHETADIAHLFGTASSLSNLRRGTLEISVDAPAEDASRGTPWAGMSGAPVWAEGRLVGIITSVSPREGPGRLAAARVERFLSGSSGHQGDLAALLDIDHPDTLVEIPSPQPKSTTPYLEQIRRIAPPTLRGRDAELAELAAFCQGEEPYALWQAPPGAGKTALMAHFALNPPPDADIVSFFASARFVGQSDSLGFTEVVLEQLAWLLGEPAPALASMHSGSQDMLRNRLLAAAAEQARIRGRRMVLLVDGLDEDSGSQRGLPSIASLLPRNPDADLRVLVSSRSTPLPDDVPADHPLRGCRVRLLEPSADAAVLRQESTRELRAVLAAGAESRDVVGLVAASRSGLTLSDLTLLTALPPYQLESLLSGNLGRLFYDRHGGAEGPPRFSFAHAMLREEAMRLLGADLMVTYEAAVRELRSPEQGRS
ncbi:caspase family protein [Streptomyces sp. NPDC057611]|uniref:caspase, EACC1-associated type n=1 Tax=Streptomyces sp. NPDC057611 TaxID=3346182 RepID=UPI00367E5744